MKILYEVWFYEVGLDAAPVGSRSVTIAASSEVDMFRQVNALRKPGEWIGSLSMKGKLTTVRPQKKRSTNGRKRR